MRRNVTPLNYNLPNAYFSRWYLAPPPFCPWHLSSHPSTYLLIAFPGNGSVRHSAPSDKFLPQPSDRFSSLSRFGSPSSSLSLSYRGIKLPVVTSKSAVTPGSLSRVQKTIQKLVRANRCVRVMLLSADEFWQFEQFSLTWDFNIEAILGHTGP